MEDRTYQLVVPARQRSSSSRKQERLQHSSSRPSRPRKKNRRAEPAAGRRARPARRAIPEVRIHEEQHADRRLHLRHA